VAELSALEFTTNPDINPADVVDIFDKGDWAADEINDEDIVERGDSRGRINVGEL
jgi:hypothetical protein